MSATWTEDHVNLLRQLWEKGTSASLIAEALANGITRNAVIGKAHRLGLKSRPSPVKNDVAEVEKPKKAAAKPAPMVVAEPTEDTTVSAPRVAATNLRPPVAHAKPSAKPAKPGQNTKRVGLLDLNEKICKWPIGHPGDDDFHFCGNPINASTPYCAEHGAIAYQSQLPRKDRRPPLPPIGGRFRV